MMEEPGRLQSMGSQRVRRDRATSLSLFLFMRWRRKWQPTPVFLPGESQGWRGLVGCCLWGRSELDTTEATWQQQQQQQQVFSWDSYVTLVVKNPSASAGDIRDLGWIPGWRRSPGRGHDNPLQYSCLENPMDRGAWRDTVHRVPQSPALLKQLSTAQHRCFLRFYPNSNIR